MHHRELQGHNRVILSPQDIYNNLGHNLNDDDDDDDEEEEEEEEEDGDDNDDDEEEEEEEENGVTFAETLLWISSNGCVLEEACPYTGIVAPPIPPEERQALVKYLLFLFYINPYSFGLSENLFYITYP